MNITERLYALERRMKAALNDDRRYAVAEKIRDLGYIDFRDFARAQPAPAHIEAVERALS
ncbi:hypothetical protein K9B33_12980 [Sphingobium sp. 3R8]|uniref:hypothetical protein n=1 Tax=Sphingobium sp. 3R8 TaxID=2874921 RepID=UPI001CCEC122|nr:hypothetical protein [Sphingobium sp. 3R8]MBZ9648461.1 hypothetical protein [Sphingobium sp. 3R8]